MTTVPSIQNRSRAIGTRMICHSQRHAFRRGNRGRADERTPPATEKKTAAPRISALIHGRRAGGDIRHSAGISHCCSSQSSFLSRFNPCRGYKSARPITRLLRRKSRTAHREYSGTIVLTRTTPRHAPHPGRHVLQVTAGWQLCAETGTWPPARQRHPRGANAKPRPRAETTAISPIICCFAFLGGIILNLMPCVLPVLSIKLLHIATSEHRTAGALRRSAWAYTAGILVSFAVLACHRKSCLAFRRCCRRLGGFSSRIRVL